MIVTGDEGAVPVRLMDWSESVAMPPICIMRCIAGPSKMISLPGYSRAKIRSILSTSVSSACDTKGSCQCKRMTQQNVSLASAFVPSAARGGDAEISATSLFTTAFLSSEVNTPEKDCVATAGTTGRQRISQSASDRMRENGINKGVLLRSHIHFIIDIFTA
jgi:hypothetical protein